MRLKGKTAWLAGVGTGMGRAAAVLFAQEGANVVITARGRDDLEETADRRSGKPAGSPQPPRATSPTGRTQSASSAR